MNFCKKECLFLGAFGKEWTIMAEKEKKQSGIVKYFKGVKSEFKKVTWPSFKQIVNNTGTVIAAVIVVGLFIFVLDYAFSAILNTIIK